MEYLKHGDRMELQLAKEAIGTKTNRLRTVMKEIEKLKQEEANLNSEIKSDKERFNTKAEAHAWPKFREFMDLFEQTLPRELRDMVYGYLAISGYQVFSSPPLAVKEGAASYIPLTNKCLFHAKFVTRTVAYEIQEFYWSKNTFDVDVGLEEGSSIQTALDIGGFNGRRLFQIVASPYKYVRHLRINLRCEKWGECGRCYGSVVPKPPYCTRHAGSMMLHLERQLSPLMQFQGQKQVHIEFVLHTTLPIVWMPQEASKASSQRHWVNILESIRWTFYTLKQSGVRVTVAIKNMPSNGPSELEMDFLRDFIWDSPGPLRNDCDLTPHLMSVADGWAKENARSGEVHKHYITPEGFSADPEEFYNRLESRWGLRRPLPWMHS